jgi:hypothetical protein
MLVIYEIQHTNLDLIFIYIFHFIQSREWHRHGAQRLPHQSWVSRSVSMHLDYHRDGQTPHVFDVVASNRRLRFL